MMRRDFRWREWIAWGRTSLVGPREVWLAGLAIAVPALVWFGLAGYAYPPFDPVQTGDYGKIELYTRLALEGSQRVGTESRFHIHHPGPVFFYAAAPVYRLFGETSKGMAAAALVWNLFWILGLLRGANRIAPAIGPPVAAVALTLFIEGRGMGWMLSSWNPNAAMLPFGVTVLAAARLATGDVTGLAIALLAGSVVVQCHMVWALPVALAIGAGLLLRLTPPLRRCLGVPFEASGSIARTLIVSAFGLGLLWALPVLDEFSGDYRNFHRIIALRAAPRSPRPWSQCIGPAVSAFGLKSDTPAQAEPGETSLGGQVRESDVLWAGAVFLASSAAGLLASRRRAATAALSLVLATAFVAAPLVARSSPGKVLPPYLFMWAAVVSVLSLFALVVEVMQWTPRVLELALRAGGLMLLAPIPVVLLGTGILGSAPASEPRDPRALEIERVTTRVLSHAQERMEGRRFLVRVSPRVGQSTAVGLILALDKAGLRFGVVPFGSVRMEGRFTPRGDEWAELLVGDLTARPDAVQLGNVDGLSAVWQGIAVRASPQAPVDSPRTPRGSQIGS